MITGPYGQYSYLRVSLKIHHGQKSQHAFTLKYFKPMKQMLLNLLQLA